MKSPAYQGACAWGTKCSDKSCPHAIHRTVYREVLCPAIANGNNCARHANRQCVYSHNKRLFRGSRFIGTPKKKRFAYDSETDSYYALDSVEPDEWTEEEWFLYHSEEADYGEGEEQPVEEF